MEYRLPEPRLISNVRERAVAVVAKEVVLQLPFRSRS